MNLKRLSKLREENSIPQKVIAKFLGVDQSTYSKYETKSRPIPAETLNQLADFYGTSTDYLLSRTNIRTPYPKLLPPSAQSHLTQQYLVADNKPPRMPEPVPDDASASMELLKNEKKKANKDS